MTSLQIVFQNPWVRALGVLLVFGLVCLLAYLLSAVLIPLFFAFIVAYMFDPVIDVFERRRISRMTAIMGLMTLLLVSLLSIPFIVVPSAVREADRLINLEPAADAGPNWIEKMLARLPAEPLLALLDDITDAPGSDEAATVVVSEVEDNGNALESATAITVTVPDSTPPATIQNPFEPAEPDEPQTAEDVAEPEGEDTDEAPVDAEDDHEVAAAEAEVQATLQNARERLADRIGGLVKQQASAFMARQTQRLATGDTSAAQPALSIFAAIRDTVLGFILFIGNFALFAFVAIYLLKDYDHIVAEANLLIPARYRPKIGDIMRRIDMQLRSFLRGQAMVVFCLGTMYAVGMLVCSVPFAIPLAVFGALASFVPYLGAVLTIGPAALLTLLAHGLDWHVIGIIATFGFAQFMEGNILTPRIVGSQVGLGPVWVILAIMVFSNAFGFAGLLLAVPLAAALKVLVTEALHLYRESAWFRELARSPAADPDPVPAPQKKAAAAKRKSAAKRSPQDRRERK